MARYLYDVIVFFTAIVTLLLIREFSKRLAVRIISSYRLKKRIKRAIERDNSSYEVESNDETIGLNKKGPIFESKVLTFIAEKNEKLINEMRDLLQQAGIRKDDALEEFMKSKMISSIAIFVILFLILTTHDYNIPFEMTCLVSLILGVLGGHKLTDLNIQLLASKRRDAIEHGVPDLVDLLVICTESGLDLTSSIRRIAREMKTSNPILADELSLTSIELEMIPDHRVSFENLENRTNSLQIKTICTTLSQSIEYGSSLSVSLRDLATESRQRRMLEAEAKAAKSPTLLTLPMMFFILPCLFIVMLGPVIIGVINSFSST